MTTLYVYSLEDNQHVATITGKDNAAFGTSGGLEENDDAECMTA